MLISQKSTWVDNKFSFIIMAIISLVLIGCSKNLPQKSKVSLGKSVSGSSRFGDSGPDVRGAVCPGGDKFCSFSFLAHSYGEQGQGSSTSTSGSASSFNGLILSQDVITDNDVSIQGLSMYFGALNSSDYANASIKLILKKNGSPIARSVVSKVESAKLNFIIDTHALGAANYAVISQLYISSNLVNSVSKKFTVVKAKQLASTDTTFSSIPLEVHQQHYWHAKWQISTGVPFPKYMLSNVDNLRLYASGKVIPAQFDVRSRWTPNGYIKWLGVNFTADYSLSNRNYNIKQGSSATGSSHAVAKAHPNKLITREDVNSITIQNGLMHATIKKNGFEGISNYRIDRNGDGSFAANEQFVNSALTGASGPFIVDNEGVLYESVHDKNAVVKVEESGPIKTIVYARGWYTNTLLGQKFNQFLVRMTFWANSKDVDIDFRTIVTYKDQVTEKRIEDSGFKIQYAYVPSKYRFGLDGDIYTYNPSTAQNNLFIHQYASNRARIAKDDTHAINDGKIGSGFADINSSAGNMAVYVKDFREKFPNEIEIKVGRRPQMIVHNWPKHGIKYYSNEDLIERDKIYKAYFAHHGDTLEFQIPDIVHDELVAIDGDQTSKDYLFAQASLLAVDPNSSQGHTFLQGSNGEGAILHSDIRLRFELHNEAQMDRKKYPVLVNTDPHALSDPVWNSKSQVLGPIQARNLSKYPQIENFLDNAYKFYMNGVVDKGDLYGKWIYGGVSNTWDPEERHASLTRVWQKSHYQNVFQAWLLYFRSGMKDHYDWADMHSINFMDVGVHNYSPGFHNVDQQGFVGGQSSHTKAFLPYDGGGGLKTHFNDTAGHLMRYYMTGDRRALEVANEWMKAWTYHLPVEDFPIYTEENCDNVYDANNNPGGYIQLSPIRDIFVSLGELSFYYANTWNIDAKFYLDQIAAEAFNQPLNCHAGAKSGLGFHKHWHFWYQALTGDPRLNNRMSEYFTTTDGVIISRDEALVAYAEINGIDTKMMDEAIGQVMSRSYIYESENGYDDQLHGTSIAISNPASMLIGRIPYLMEAADRQGKKMDLSDFSYLFKVGAVNNSHTHPRGWTRSSSSIIGYYIPTDVGNPLGNPINYDYTTAMITKIRGLGNSEQYKIRFMNGLPTLAYEHFNWSVPTGSLGYELFSEELFPYDTGTPFMTGAYIRPVRNKNWVSLDYIGEAIRFPVLYNSREHGSSARALEHQLQVLPLIRAYHPNNPSPYKTFHIKGAIDGYLAPLVIPQPVNSVSLHKTLTISLKQHKYRYWYPSSFTIYDANGQLVHSLHTIANEHHVVSIDPNVHPYPWRVVGYGTGDNQLQIYHDHAVGQDDDTVKEMLFSKDPIIFDKLREDIVILDQMPH